MGYRLMVNVGLPQCDSPTTPLSFFIMHSSFIIFFVINNLSTHTLLIASILLFTQVYMRKKSHTNHQRIFVILQIIMMNSTFASIIKYYEYEKALLNSTFASYEVIEVKEVRVVMPYVSNYWLNFKAAKPR